MRKPPSKPKPRTPPPTKNAPREPVLPPPHVMYAQIMVHQQELQQVRQELSSVKLDLFLTNQELQQAKAALAAEPPEKPPAKT